MQLHRPLVLESAKTADVSLTPTKKFFKPVLVLDAPLTIECAALLECAYLFDGAGNPHHFEGHHKLEGELSGAIVDIAGKVTTPVTLTTEKVAHVACYRAEKKGMRVQLRIHLPEDEAKLVELLHFLASLNKEGFTATVTPAQGTLIGVLAGTEPPREDETFRYPVADRSTSEFPIQAAAKQPFTSKNLEMRLYSMEIAEDLYISGWSLNWKKKVAGGSPLVANKKLHPNSREAFREAAIEAHQFLLANAVPKGVKEISDHEAGLAWLQNIVPDLARGQLLAEGEYPKGELQ